MLSPEYIDHLPDRVVELYADLEIRILEDMARRISKTGALTETAQWQMWRLEQIGAEREFIRYHLQRLTGKTQGEINELLVEAGEEALYYDDQIYRAAGLSPKALRDSEALQKIIKAGSDKTMRLFENLTSTTADTASRQFENALDAAYMDITSGAFSYQDAVRSAVKSLSVGRSLLGSIKRRPEYRPPGLTKWNATWWKPLPTWAPDRNTWTGRAEYSVVPGKAVSIQIS